MLLMTAALRLVTRSWPEAVETHAAVFMSWASPIDLGGAQSQAFGINTRDGDIVGFETVAGQPHAALWVHAGGTWKIADINSLLDPTSGWIIDFAYAINDRGSIEATGRNSDAINITHSLLLTTLRPAATIPRNR